METTIWRYISEDKGWGFAQVSPDGKRILVKEIKQNQHGIESKYSLIDVDTCKKSNYSVSGSINLIEDNKAN